MNNKGFAITGILYTIFILFIMTLLAILSGLNTRLKLMEKSVMSFQDDYSQKNNLVTTSNDNDISFRTNALYTGKYIFKVINSEQNNDKFCILYIRRGANIKDNSNFINNDNFDCREYLNNGKLSLVALYKFS